MLEVCKIGRGEGEWHFMLLDDSGVVSGQRFLTHEVFKSRVHGDSE